MPTWQEFMRIKGHPPKWPYPIRYEEEQEIDTDVLVIGGGIAGCWAAISAARKGVKVALVEKSATIRSGAGAVGCDHWTARANPLSNVDPGERAQELIGDVPGYRCGIVSEISSRESYDTLLELEKMGGKVRDYDDEFKGAEGRDDKTKLMLSPRGSPQKVTLRVWGTTFKPALKNECERLGVKIYDRVMVTGLLNENGEQGAKVVGAIGVNDRTGELMVFKAKASVISTARNQAIWVFSTELVGIQSFRPRTVSGDGTTMAWRAGAALNSMERSGRGLWMGTGYNYPEFATFHDSSYENVPLVDNNGKVLPGYEPRWGWRGESTDVPMRKWDAIREGVLKGEYALPFYADFPSMPDVERRATWNLMLSEEGKCRIMNKMWTDAGFDPSRDQIPGYQLIGGKATDAHGVVLWRYIAGGSSGGGVHVDWDLKTTLDGLYCAGDTIYSCVGHSTAASTGRYAGRKAADYALQVGDPVISKEQVAIEKARIYAPIKRNSGIEWKELHAGICRAMQNYCSEYKTESLLNMGLDSLNEIEESWVPRLYALDPHKLMRSLEDLSILTVAQTIIHASLVRKASSNYLGFRRIDYPETDPPEWNKFVTIRLENGKVKSELLPLNYWGDLKENYEARNKDYTGVYKG